MIKFEEVAHKYESIDGSDIKWTSVTSLTAMFKEKFDGVTVAQKVIKNKKSKWYGFTVDRILDIWKKEADRACDLGSWYHAQREAEILSFDTIGRWGKEIPVIHPIFSTEGFKISPEQRLTDGIYPEHMVYLKSAGICGQSDLVEVIDGKVYITDYKTNKEIKTESFVNWEGKSKKMMAPLHHLDDCNYNHYNLQLSLYLYMILKHNPQLKPGGLRIHHIKFKEGEPDEFGYPNTVYDESGNPIVEKIEIYEMKYLKEEVINMIKYKNG